VMYDKLSDLKSRSREHRVTFSTRDGEENNNQKKRDNSLRHVAYCIAFVANLRKYKYYINSISDNESTTYCFGKELQSQPTSRF